jgi:CRP/FNR family transcriptional regulator, dissimilatory nitrate respiration regulator
LTQKTSAEEQAKVGEDLSEAETDVMTSCLSELKQIGLTSALRNCRLFTGLPSSDLVHIAAIAMVKPLEKGDYLFREGDSSHGFYIVQTGAISVHRFSSVGKEQIIHVFRTGESFAEAALATETGYPADARAIEPSQVLLIQKSGFLDLLRRQPELAFRMLGSMSLQLRLLIGQIEDLTLKNMETRLASWLLYRCPDPGSRQPFLVELKMSKRILATELGTVSETLSRTLAKLRDQNLIQVNGKSLTVLCPARLSEAIEVNAGL